MSKTFNWNSKRDVENLMRSYRSKFSRWSDVRKLSDEEMDLWVSLDYYLTCKDGFCQVKQMLYNYCMN